MVLRLDELDDDGADLLLHVAPLHQALLKQHQQRRLRRLPDLINDIISYLIKYNVELTVNYLVVHVGEELDDHGEEVLRDHVQVGGLHLLAVHGDVGHLERIEKDTEASDTAGNRSSCRGRANRLINGLG